MRVKVDAKFKPPAQVMRELGVDERGKVQVYATERILTRMRKYMPWLTGDTATKYTQMTGPTSITVNQPHARYIYNGVSKSGKPLEYNQTAREEGLPERGAHWDRTMMQFEGEAIAQDIENYAKGLKR